MGGVEGMGALGGLRVVGLVGGDFPGAVGKLPRGVGVPHVSVMTINC